MNLPTTLQKPQPAPANVNWLQRRSTKERVLQLLAYVICTGIGLAYVFPLYWMVATALKTDAEIFLFPPTWWPQAPQWQNFPASTTYIPFWLYIRNTLIVSGLTILGTLVSCS